MLFLKCAHDTGVVLADAVVDEHRKSVDKSNDNDCNNDLLDYSESFALFDLLGEKLLILPQSVRLLTGIAN